MSQIDNFETRYARFRNPKTAPQAVAETEKEPKNTENTGPSVLASAKPVATPERSNRNAKRPTARQLPDDIVAELNTYFYGKANYYGDKVGDYIAAEEESPKEKISRSLDIIDYMSEEFRKPPADRSQSGLSNISRKKLVSMAVLLYYDSGENAKVAKKVEKFLGRVSEVSQKDYIRHGKDSFLSNLLTAYQRNALQNSDTLLWDSLFSRHIEGMWNKIEKQKNKESDEIQDNKLKYARLLCKKEFGTYFESYIPDELLKAVKEKSDNLDEKKTKPAKGDKPMTDEVEKDNEKPNKAPDFTLTKAQLWAAEKASVNWKECKSAEEVVSKAKDAGYIVEGDKVFKLGENGAKDLVAEYDKDKDAMVEKGKDGRPQTEENDDKKNDGDEKKKHLTIEGTDPQEEKNERPQPEKPLDWVQEKIDNYTDMLNKNIITSFTYDKEVKDEFVAEVNGDSVHYKSKDNLSISQTAKIETFEAVLAEKHNEGRAINFGENMSHEMSVRLMAACLLHGNEMMGKVPTELSPEDMQTLKTELGERYNQFAEAWNARNKPQEEKVDEPKTDEPKADEKKNKVEVIISSPEELDKFLADAQKARANLKELREKGEIAFGTDPETQKAKIVAGPNLEGRTDLTDAQKQQLLDNANRESDLLVAVKQAHDKYNKQKIEKIRSRIDQKKLAEHDATRQAKLEARQKADKEMAEKLGITNDSKGESKALTGEEFEKYIKDNHINQFTYERLNNKFNPGKEMTDAQKEVFGKLPEAPKMQRDTSRGK